MKKLIAIVFALVLFSEVSGQNKKVQDNIDQIKMSITSLDKLLEAQNWSDSKYFIAFRREVTLIEVKIKNIKTEDPNYNVSDYETKYSFYKTKLDDGKKIKDGAKEEKSKKENEALVAKFIVKDDGITNPIHEKNAGKIVFSSTEISKENPDESKFGNGFSISSTIYLRVFLKTSVFNEVQKNNSSEAFEDRVGVLYRIYLDGNKAEEGRVEFSNDGKKFLTKEQMKTQTSIGGAFNFSKDAFLSAAYIDGLLAADAKLTDGEHVFKIELYPIYTSVKPLTETPMAAGEFKLKIAKGFATPSNANVCMPKAVKKDAALETKYKECIKKYLVNNNKDAVMKSFVLLSNDWEIRKNDITSVPISRTMYGAAGLTYKDGRCKYETYSFTQNWNGSSYSTTIETSTTGQDRNVFCDCFK